MHGPGDLSCREIVELVTAYLDGALDDDTGARFELHVMTCRGCEMYLAQMRDVATLVGEAREPVPDPAQLAALTQAFRGWRRSAGEG